LRGARATGRIVASISQVGPMSAAYSNFREFYSFYLSQHANRTCRRLHFTGTSLIVVVVVAACATQHWIWLLAIPLCGYGFAWLGHFAFEHNRPATFTHPFYSLAGDWVMWWQTLTGRIRF
jgi:hypothetical protein